MSERKNFSQRRYLISSVLSPAVELWLRSQVDRVERLEVKITGRNQQILEGYIPSIVIHAEQAVYRGLHLSRICLSGKKIQINLPQVLKGQPLRLLEPIAIAAELQWNQTDLNASLQTPILQEAIASSFGSLRSQSIDWKTSQVTLKPDRLALTVTKPEPIAMEMGLQPVDGNKLQPIDPQIRTPSTSNAIATLESVTWELGSDIRLDKLSLHLQHLICCGRLKVRSE
ncbi:MAG: DUF2993 domain-containing protein [Cyanobacteriota bacterium]|nr:DUF2993 domain-containing protein [Cyanobacteriota bacterium]